MLKYYHEYIVFVNCEYVLYRLYNQLIFSFNPLFPFLSFIDVFLSCRSISLSYSNALIQQARWIDFKNSFYKVGGALLIRSILCSIINGTKIIVQHDYRRSFFRYDDASVINSVECWCSKSKKISSSSFDLIGVCAQCKISRHSRIYSLIDRMFIPGLFIFDRISVNVSFPTECNFSCKIANESCRMCCDVVKYSNVYLEMYNFFFFFIIE